MPNAKDLKRSPIKRFLVQGKIGSGKSVQVLTLPGKKFGYFFDGSALDAVSGYDIDYEEFLPKVQSMDLVSLSEKHGARSSSKGADLYNEWERDFEKRIRENFFKSYDWLILDSATTLLDMVMDGVLQVNQRGGQWPRQDDYGPQMLTFIKIVRTSLALGLNIYLTTHTESQKDEVTGRITEHPMMTGRLRTKIPLLFSEVIILEGSSSGKTSNWSAQFRPDSRNRAVRTTLRTINYKEDVTIDWSKPLHNQGLGKYYNVNTIT